MNFKISTVTVCAMALFSSQVVKAGSITLSDMPEVASIGENPDTALVADTVSHETTVSQVTRYNNILSKTVTTVERNDTLSAPIVRWNLAFNIAALSGDKKDKGGREDALALAPLKFEAKYPTVYFGKADHTSDAFALDLSRSFVCGVYLLKGGWAFTKNNPDNVFGVTAALGWSSTYLTLDDKDVFYIDEEGRTVCSPLEGQSYHKPRLSYWSLRLPVSLQWSYRVGRRVDFFSVGAEAEYRSHIRSYVSYKGDANHRMASHPLAVNPWACNLLIQWGINHWGLFMRTSFTEFFDHKSTDLGGRPVEVALSVTF